MLIVGLICKARQLSGNAKDFEDIFEFSSSFETVVALDVFCCDCVSSASPRSFFYHTHLKYLEFSLGTGLV